MGDRTKRSFLNVGSNFIINMIGTIFSFITRTVFVYCLGESALGLNGLFSNVLSMLSLAELGIGSAINFSLYEPLAKKDTKKINSLMRFYKKAYRTIGTIIAILGILLIPFLKYLIKDIENIENVYIIYILYLINTVSTYFIAYKETLINADQKNYKLLKIETNSLVLLNTLQIVFLLLTKNFIIYLTTCFIVQFIKRIITNRFITKTYDNIDFESKEKIEKKDLDVIVKNVKAMFFHKIGDYCINGTDNLIISSFINVMTVGFYSNYLTIINLLNTFIRMLYNGITASLGNFVAIETNERKEAIFRKMNFIGFLLHGICTVCLINLFNPFIRIWVGEKYCLDFSIVLIIVINFYLTGMRLPPQTMKSAAGLFDVDKYTPLVQSIINLIVSIVLVQKIGLLGVLIGTLVSSITIPCWQRPYLVYKYVLKMSSKKYFVEYFKYILIIVVASLTSIYINKFLVIGNQYIAFIIKGLISSIVFIVFTMICYAKTDEMKYILNFGRKIIKGNR